MAGEDNFEVLQCFPKMHSPTSLGGENKRADKHKPVRGKNKLASWLDTLRGGWGCTDALLCVHRRWWKWLVGLKRVSKPAVRVTCTTLYLRFIRERHLGGEAGTPGTVLITLFRLPYWVAAVCYSSAPLALSHACGDRN